MPTEQLLPATDPRMVAWKEYKATHAYDNTKKWASHEKHAEGSLWAAFIAGFEAAKSTALADKKIWQDYLKAIDAD